jgi:beta-lactamase superfamily II metal-dependent hydrolase
MKSRIIIFCLIVFAAFINCKEGGNIGGNNDSKGAGQDAPIVGKVLPDWQEGCLDIHAINTGRGESTLYIFPDGTTMLVDAAGSLISESDPIPPPAIKPNASVTPGQAITNYVRHFVKAASNKLNYILISHWDSDHMGGYSTSLPAAPSGKFLMGGITEVGAKIEVNNIIDRGYPDYNFPSDMSSIDKMANYIKFTEWTKESYGTVIEQFKVGRSDQITLKQNPSKYSNFQIRNVISNGVVWTGNGTEVRNTLPSANEVVAGSPGENIFSIGFHLKYGQFDYFAGGDLQYNGRSTYSWKDVEAPVAEVMTAVDVLKANHHGTSNCNSDGFLKKLKPQTVLIHTWRDVQPNPETIGRMFSVTSNCNIFTTNTTEANKERLGNYLAKIKGLQGHIVVRVEPRGDKYTVYVLDDSNENYKVKSVFGPYTCN